MSKDMYLPGGADFAFQAHIKRKEQLQKPGEHKLSRAGVVGLEFVDQARIGLLKTSGQIVEKAGGVVRINREVLGSMSGDERMDIYRNLAALTLGVGIASLDLFVKTQVVDPRDFISQYDFALSGTCFMPIHANVPLVARRLSGRESVPVWRKMAEDPTHTSYFAHMGAQMPIEYQRVISWKESPTIGDLVIDLLKEYDQRAQCALGLEGEKKIPRNWEDYTRF